MTREQPKEDKIPDGVFNPLDMDLDPNEPARVPPRGTNTNRSSIVQREDDAKRVETAVPSSEGTQDAPIDPD